MVKTPFYNVHKDFAQEGPIYGHEEFHGLTLDAAKAKFHQLLSAAYTASDPWTYCCIISDTGVMEAWEVVDRRTVPEPEVPEEGGNAE